MSYQGEDRSVHFRRMSVKGAFIVFFIACSIGGTTSSILDPIVT